MRQDFFDIDTQIGHVCSRTPLRQELPTFKQSPDARKIEPGRLARIGGNMHDAQFRFRDEP